MDLLSQLSHTHIMHLTHYICTHSLSLSLFLFHSLTHIHVIDACSSNSCSGNGTCYNLASGGYECICYPGAYGPNCNISSNAPCFDPGIENCYGNGVCEMIYKDGSPFPNCTCFPEYQSSTKCEFLAAYNVCEYERPCQNGGICSHISAYNYKCECPPGKCVCTNLCTCFGGRVEGALLYRTVGAGF